MIFLVDLHQSVLTNYPIFGSHTKGSQSEESILDTFG